MSWRKIEAGFDTLDLRTREEKMRPLAGVGKRWGNRNRRSKVSLAENLGHSLHNRQVSLTKSIICFGNLVKSCLTLEQLELFSTPDFPYA